MTSKWWLVSVSVWVLFKRELVLLLVYFSSIKIIKIENHEIARWHGIEWAVIKIYHFCSIISRTIPTVHKLWAEVFYFKAANDHQKLGYCNSIRSFRSIRSVSRMQERKYFLYPTRISQCIWSEHSINSTVVFSKKKRMKKILSIVFYKFIIHEFIVLINFIGFY